MEEEHLRRAIELARRSVRNNLGGPFGAVVVQAGNVVGEGWNEVTTAKDPTAHAEVGAIRQACQNLDDFSLAGCEIYTSCQPCPMCLAAIMWARLDRIYFAADAKDAQLAGFDDAAFYEQLERSPSDRMIPQRQALQAEAQQVFAEWNAKEDKTAY